VRTMALRLAQVEGTTTVMPSIFPLDLRVLIDSIAGTSNWTALQGYAQRRFPFSPESISKREKGVLAMILLLYSWRAQ
jgi:hypothetical protein